MVRKSKKSVINKKREEEGLCPIGRPREWTDEKLIELGEDLIKYVTKRRIWHLSHYEAQKDLPIDCLRYCHENYSKMFTPYYKRAMQILGHNLLERAMSEDKCDKFVISVFIPMYLKDVRKFQDDRREKEVKFKYEMIQKVGEKLDSKAQTLIDAVDSLCSDKVKNAKSS